MSIIYIYVCVHTHTYIYIYAYIYTYMYTNTNTHVHTFYMYIAMLARYRRQLKPEDGGAQDRGGDGDGSYNTTTCNTINNSNNT